MFSIMIEEVFRIRNGKVVLSGRTSGEIRVGDYLTDISDKTKQYKVTVVEMSITLNPSIMIEPNNYELM